MNRGLRLAARALAVLGVVLAVLAVRAVTASRSELARGDALREAEDLDGAMLAYRRAARWYAPGNPYVTQALDRLGRLADERAAAGDSERSLAAWRSVRGAILATRSFYTPHRSRLERAESAIADAVAAEAATTTRERVRRASFEGMQQPAMPHLGWTLLLLVGWLSWTGGAFAFAQRAIDEEDRVRSQPARVLGTLIVMGFGLFVLGMALA